MTTIGIIVAMNKEFELLKELLSDSKLHQINNLKCAVGNLGDKRIVIMQSGIGKVCAAVATVEFIKKFQPQYIINSGLAGGIDSKCKVMDIVAGSEVVYHDVWCGEGNSYGQVQGLPPRYQANQTLLSYVSDCHIGLICSGDKFISNSQELSAIKEQFPQGLAVDMESGAIAQVCHIYNIPFLSLRIISDNPGIDNHWQQYQNFWQQAPQTSLSIIKHILNQIS